MFRDWAQSDLYVIFSGKYLSRSFINLRMLNVRLLCRRLFTLASAPTGVILYSFRLVSFVKCLSVIFCRPLNFLHFSFLLCRDYFPSLGWHLRWLNHVFRAFSALFCDRCAAVRLPFGILGLLSNDLVCQVLWNIALWRTVAIRIETGSFGLNRRGFSTICDVLHFFRF